MNLFTNVLGEFISDAFLEIKWAAEAQYICFCHHPINLKLSVFAFLNTN